MGRDWSKQRKRDVTNRSRQQEIDNAGCLARAVVEHDHPELTKDQLRAEALALVAQYRGNVRQLPTLIELKCYRCNHRGRAKVWPGGSKRFKCSRCGATSI